MSVLFRRIPALTVLVCILFGLLSIMALSAPFEASAKVITQTVDISTIREAASGDGYVWSNRYKTMTFTNLNLRTEDDYGFRFPSGATLILKGNNVISAKLVALAGQDSLKIKGDGTLTLIADTGIKMVSPEYTSSLTFMEGKVTIQATSCGIQSDFPTVIVGNTTLDIQVSDPHGSAIKGYSVMLNNGTLNANAPIVSANGLSLGGCALSISASSPALVGKEITLAEGNKLFAGATSKDLSAVEAYENQNAVRIDPLRSMKPSLLLGEGFPVYWDYILLGASVLLLAAAIVLPILYKRRKDAIKRAKVQARREAEEKERKEAAKAARRARYGQ